MRDTSLLQLALGLVPPWAVIRSEFDAEARQLDIHIDFAAGSRFACPCCGAADCPAYDTEQMSWRHLDFFQHQAFLYARVPRVHCTRCGIKTLSVPWARPDSGFTLLFEALVMSLVSAMPVNAVARLVGEHDTRLWRVIHHYVDRARAKADLSTVRRVAIDETAARRGHNYITLFVDIDQARVVFATDGRDAETIAFFADDLTMHGGAPSAIAEVCIDMSPAFIKGIANSLPAAAITFDKFHAVKIVNDAVDQVRRAERKVHNVLAGTRYLWLRNPVNLSDRQRAAFENLPLRHLKTARAYRIRLAFQELYDQPTPDAATVFLKKSVLLGNPQPAAANHRCRAHCQAPLERHPALVPQQDSQWPHRGDQQPRPSRQSKGSRLPLSPQPQSHGLPARSQTQSHASKLRSLLPMPNSEEPVYYHRSPPGI